MSTSILPIFPLHAVGDFIHENHVISLLIFIVIIAQIAGVYFLILPIGVSTPVKYLLSLPNQWLHWLVATEKNVLQIVSDFRKGRFYIPYLKKKPTVVRTLSHIHELADSPELSQRAVYADIFGFRYTMTYEETTLDPNEQTAARYRLFSRAIKAAGTAQLPALQPHLSKSMDRIVSQYIDSQEAVDGWKTVKLAPFMREMATEPLAIYFFGSQLCGEPDFAAAIRGFYKDVMKFMGALQFVPSFMTKTVYSRVTNNGLNLRVIIDRLSLAMDPSKDGWEEDDELKSITLLYNMIKSSEGSAYWTPAMLTQAIAGIWFAGSHQPWINLHFVFLELCSRPTYADLIRHEIAAHPSLDVATLSQLPLLDSFIKECLRLNPLDEMGIRRKALQPFTFSNGGPSLAVGDIACVSAYDIMHNTSKYPSPHSFDGTRFVLTSAPDTPAGEGMRGTYLTDASRDWPIWGLGSRVCPGRWHAALVLKMAVVKLLAGYEFQLKDEGLRHKWWWETFQMPAGGTEVLFRKREGA